MCAHLGTKRWKGLLSPPPPVKNPLKNRHFVSRSRDDTRIVLSSVDRSAGKKLNSGDFCECLLGGRETKTEMGKEA